MSAIAENLTSTSISTKTNHRRAPIAGSISFRSYYFLIPDPLRIAVGVCCQADLRQMRDYILYCSRRTGSAASALSQSGLNRKQPAKEGTIPPQSQPQILSRNVFTLAPLALQLVPFIGENFRQALHRSGNQIVGILYRLTRLIDEPDLYRIPLPAKVTRFTARKKRPGFWLHRRSSGRAGSSFACVPHFCSCRRWSLTACSQIRGGEF